MRFKVYILFSSTHNKIYIGYTSDLAGRILSHNLLATKGWTVKFRPWILVHQEDFETTKKGNDPGTATQHPTSHNINQSPASTFKLHQAWQ